MEVVELGVKESCFVVSGEEVRYKVRCRGCEFRVGDKESIKDGRSSVRIECNYGE